MLGTPQVVHHKETIDDRKQIYLYKNSHTTFEIIKGSYLY